jgi:hypothetical protein
MGLYQYIKIILDQINNKLLTHKVYSGKSNKNF